MRFITDLLELEGKTIDKACSVDCGESIVLIFTDGTCAYFDVDFYGDSHDIELACDAPDYLKTEAGIISAEEFERREAEIESKRAEQAKQKELAELARLKEKYGE